MTFFSSKKHFCPKRWLWAFFVALPMMASAQTQVFGTLTDSTDQSPAVGVSVLVYRYQSKAIFTFGITDPNGSYRLGKPLPAGIYTLKTRSLAYKTLSRDLVLADTSRTELEISFPLPPSTTTLQEVAIEAKRPPVIVKQDTVIYHMEHWERAGDQTLEQVLSRFPGLKILGDGELEFNGKPIGKVLVNGEEVTNSGAALLTRSLSPQDIESVEIRTDEKDRKLKDSLLDSDKLMVLDIKLKKELNQSLFGKLTAHLGQQENTLRPGGMANFFSLKKKQKTHFFAEYDRFGDPAISLAQIKFIGQEAMQKIFDLPADFEGMQQKSEFNNELYGFNDLTRSENAIAGLTSRFTLSEHTELYAGSYNAFSQKEKQRTYRQVFENGQYRLLEDQRINDYSSKNKLELRHDRSNFKLRADWNAVFGNNRYQDHNQESEQALDYRFRKDQREHSFYQNLFAEVVLSEKTGLQAKSSLSWQELNLQNELLHNDSLWLRYLPDHLPTDLPSKFGQGIPVSGFRQYHELAVQHRSKAGTFRLGAQATEERLRSGKEAFLEARNNRAPVQEAVFNGAKTTYRYRSAMPYLQHQLSVSGVSLTQQAGVRWVEFPELNAPSQTARLFEYDGKLSYSWGTLNDVAITYFQRVSPFPLAYLMPGYELLGFRAVGLPQQTSFTPQLERVAQLVAGQNVPEWHLQINFAGIIGQTRKSPQFGFSAPPIVETNYAQLKADYQIGLFTFIKTFEDHPLTIELEPSFMRNSNQNIVLGIGEYTTRTDRYMLELRANTNQKESPFSLLAKLKYSDFVFTNELLAGDQKQQMVSWLAVGSWTVFQEKMVVSALVRQVFFRGLSESDNLLADVSIRYLLPNGSVFLGAENLFDTATFARQTITPAFFSDDRQAIFGRVIKVGASWKWR